MAALRVPETHLFDFLIARTAPLTAHACFSTNKNHNETKWDAAEDQIQHFARLLLKYDQ